MFFLNYGLHHSRFKIIRNRHSQKGTIYDIQGGGAHSRRSREMIPDLMSTISSIKNLRKFSQVAADSAKPAATGGLTPVFILLQKTPGLYDCVC